MSIQNELRPKTAGALQPPADGVSQFVLNTPNLFYGDDA